MTKFSFPCCDIEVEFTPEVVKDLGQFRQIVGYTEAGGLLFTSDLYSNPILIEKFSIPSAQDKRTRHRFIPHKTKAQKIINEMFENGFHYVGDWHTHPQKHPKPSRTDINTIKDVFKKSDHNLNYMLMLVLSNSEDFENSYLGLTNGTVLFEPI